MQIVGVDVVFAELDVVVSVDPDHGIGELPAALVGEAARLRNCGVPNWKNPLRKTLGGRPRGLT